VPGHALEAVVQGPAGPLAQVILRDQHQHRAQAVPHEGKRLRQIAALLGGHGARVVDPARQVLISFRTGDVER
jgi:hypothetical protein